MAALVGPLLVDWTAYRTQFESQASEILGHPVRVAGAADATLIPVPSLTFTDVVIGADAGEPLMTVERFDVQVELFPLLQGRIQVTDMRLAEPVLTVRVASDGAFEWLADGSGADFDPAQVTLERVEIADGRIRILDQRRATPIEIDDVNANLEARSLVGPYKLDGTALVEGEPVTVRLSTGSPDGSGQIVTKMAVTPANRPVAITLDGRLGSEAGGVRWAGTTRIERVVTEADEGVLPWQLTADTEFDATRLLMKDLEYRYGPEDRPFSITGAATVSLATDPSFTAVLSARQIDLDRTLGAGPDQPADFQAVVAALSRTLAALPEPPIPGSIGFDIPGIVVGGSMVTGVTLDLTTAPDGWRLETLDASLPGQTRLNATGDLATRPALAFEGNVALASDQPAALVSWWHPDRPRTQLGAFDARGRVTASASGVAVTSLDASVAESRVTGEIAYVPASSGRAARLNLSLGATELDVAEAQSVVALFGGGEGEPAAIDVVIQLAAGTLRAGETTADGLDLAASLVGGTLAVDRFAVRNLAGARISAAGTIRDLGTAPDGSFQGRISAERLDGLATLVRTLAPGSQAATLLTTAAPVLVPATLEATVNARADGQGTDASLSLEGTAGGSTLEGSLAFQGRVDRWRDAYVRLSLALEGPNGVRLMRQLGIDVPDVDSAGAGALTLDAAGRPGTEVIGGLSGRLGETEIGVKGSLRLPADAAGTADLDVSLKSADAGPILALSGSTMADLLSSTPVDLAAAVTVEGAVARLAGLSGTVDGAPLTGDLTADLGGAVTRLSGSLALESASLEALAELALGPGTLAFPIIESRSPWPEAPFGLAPLDQLETDVALRLEAMPVGETLVVNGVSMALRSSAAGVGFDDITGEIAGGSLSGHVLIKQDLEGTAAVSGALALEGAAASDLVWRRNDRAVVTGRLSLNVDGSATGRTVAGLVSSLSGGGSFRITDGEIRSFNPQAFSAVIRAADGGQEFGDDRIRQVFEDNVDVGDLAFERLEGTFTLAGGVLRAPNVAVTGTAGETSGSATVDLARQRLESDWRVAFDPSDAAVAGGAVPQVSVLFRGALDQPTRSLDVTALSSWLGIRAFERETERVLRMQADILERELLSRQVLRDKEAAERAAREAEAERIRAEEEAARLLAEEEARRQAEEAARSAPPTEATPPVRTVPVEPPAPEPNFADEIMRQLERNQPRAPRAGDPLPALPGVNIAPPPGGLGQ